MATTTSRDMALAKKILKNYIKAKHEALGDRSRLEDEVAFRIKYLAGWIGKLRKRKD